MKTVQEKKFEQTKWRLSDLLEAPSGAPLENALVELEARTTDFEKKRARLTPEISADEFIRRLHEFEAVEATLTKLGAYASLWFAEDTQSQDALSFRSRVQQIAADIQNRVLFFSLWWKGLDDATAARLMALPNLGDYRYFLETERRFKPHTLSEAEEKIINIKDVNGIGGVLTVYDMITNKYVFSLAVNGVEKKMTQGELMTYARDPSPEVRAAAYAELYRVYKQDSAVLAQIYVSRVNDWRAEQLQLRHYATPITLRNLANDVPDEAVETLLQVSRANTSIFQRYFRLKAKWLGLNPLRRSDLYAPLAQADKNFPYADAVDLVLDSFEKFSPRVAQAARNVFADHHIDSEVRAGKRSGAFCASVLPQLTPYVLINYTSKPRDVSVLAHELGHAIHSQLAREHSLLTFHSGLPMAETASVFSEMILNERLLKENSDPAVRRDILARRVDDAYATVMRQAFFVLFEKDAHIAIEQGKTMDELNALYLDILREQFGDAVEIADDFQYEWIVIPHIFHTPFYTYAYSFGQLLTLSLYQRYRDEGASFVPKYEKILSYGGSESPAKILGEAGIDINSAEFWQGGYDVVTAFINQLEKLEVTREE
jgi:oligoendopeptidase F